jgi:hypothetical protein
MDDEATSDGEYTSSTNTMISNAQSHLPDGYGYRAGMLRDRHVDGFASASDGGCEATLSDGVNVPTNEGGRFSGRKESTEIASDHSEAESDKITSEYQNDRNDESDADNASGEDDRSEGDGESEQSQEDNGGDQSEDNGGSAYDYNPASIATNRRHLTEDDALWMIGLGSLNGYQLASSTYLRQLFTHRRISTQISMLKTVLGAGAMRGDTYERHRDGDLLGDLLSDLNTLFFGPGIERRAFKRQQMRRHIKIALYSMSSTRVTDNFRWHCFRKALAMRSQSVCSVMLCSRAFNFSEDEWSELEDDAKRASEAFYTPRRVRRFLGRRFGV